MQVLCATLLVSVALAGCGGGESQQTPRLAVQPPTDPDTPHPQPAWDVPLRVSESNCFALGDPPTAIVYAPDGAAVLPDGDGFSLSGREFRLGQPLEGFSVLVRDFEDIPSPSQSLIDCEPTRVAWVWPDW